MYSLTPCVDIPANLRVRGCTWQIWCALGRGAGSSWFDANISKIGSNAQQLATQGAGSPWVPLATSTRKGFSPTEPEDPLAARKRAVAQRQLEAQEKKYGITP